MGVLVNAQGFAGNTHDLISSFTYNSANQVTKITRSNAGYQYQGNENIEGSYKSNSLNQYYEVAGKTLTYDTNGNFKTDAPSSYAYAYDDENRLTSKATPGGNTASFEYDPVGRLYQTTLKGVVTQYLYDGDALVGEYNASGTMTARYVHGDQVDEPWVEFAGASTSLSNTRFLHSNHQGSIIAQSNTSAAVTATNAYDTYGVSGGANTYGADLV